VQGFCRERDYVCGIKIVLVAHCSVLIRIIKNLENYGVYKISTREIKEINGGWIVGWINRIMEDWLTGELPPNN
jgi:hypothetical protein